MAEGLAAAGSVLCLVHCLVLPLLLLFLPAALAVWLMAEWVHLALLALVAPLAVLVLWLGWRRHRQPGPAMSGLAGLALLAAAVLPGHGSMIETALSVAGSLLLVVAHYRNWRLRACLCQAQ